MFNKIITHQKNKLLFRSVTYFLIFSFIMTLNGCVTTYTGDISDQELIKGTDAKIISVEMKDGRVINLEGKKIKILSVYKEFKNVIVYEDLIRTEQSKDKTMINSNIETKVIELKDVFKIKNEESHVNIGATALLVIVVLGIVFILISLSASKGGLRMGEF